MIAQVRGRLDWRNDCRQEVYRVSQDFLFQKSDDLVRMYQWVQVFQILFVRVTRVMTDKWVWIEISQEGYYSFEFCECGILFFAWGECTEKIKKVKIYYSIIYLFEKLLKFTLSAKTIYFMINVWRFYSEIKNIKIRIT